MMFLALWTRVIAEATGARHYRRRKTDRRFYFERLESRQMLAANISFDANTGIIAVSGTNLADLVDVVDIGADVQVTVTGGNLQVFDRAQVSGLTFNAGFGDDILTAGTTVPITAFGHAGIDQLSGSSSADYIHGGLDDDQIVGNGGNDQLFGGDGIDTIFGSTGDDIVLAGPGDDFVHGGPGNDQLSGDQGNDEMDGFSGDDQLSGYLGDDVLIGGQGADRVYGQAGADQMFGESGVDRLRGGNGDDTAYGGDNNDLLNGDDGNDELYGQGNSDRLYGYVGQDFLDGGDGDDFLYGQQDADLIEGGDGDDALRGGDADDEIYGLLGDDFANGDAGNDLIYGGADADRVFGGAGDDSLYGESGEDVVNGDAGNDRLLGGNSQDDLSGGADSDSLFGGQRDDGDTLRGDGSDDRFLVQFGDIVLDQLPEDGVLNFLNFDHAWTDDEIEVLDGGFAQLHDRTQNTALLKDSLPSGDLTFYKYADLGGASGVNYLETTTYQEWNGSEWVTVYEYHRELRIAEWNENDPFMNAFYKSVAIHEIGHNWDSQLELETASSNLAGVWSGFLAISDWRDVNPNNPTYYSQSYDGDWWYLNSAGFADDYGRTNPNEDFSTVWEFYFSGDSTGNSSLQAKLDTMDVIFDELMA